MKKKVFISIILLVFTYISFFAYKYYAPVSLKQPFQLGSHDDTLRIAFIGDSWAFMHKEHDCSIEEIIEGSISKPVKVYSYGVCGLTSKEIYENIYNNSEFQLFLKKRGYDYCIISAGINDANKKMSTHYYQEGLNAILQFMLANKVFPIILEIPDYDINKTFERQKKSRIVLRHLSMFINKTPLDCKQLFRDALDKMIYEKGYLDKVYIIRYNKWNNDYYNDLIYIYLDDGLHLNEKGYAKLDSVIANSIIALH